LVLGFISQREKLELTGSRGEAGRLGFSKKHGCKWIQHVAVRFPKFRDGIEFPNFKNQKNLWSLKINLRFLTGMFRPNDINNNIVNAVWDLPVKQSMVAFEVLTELGASLLNEEGEACLSFLLACMFFLLIREPPPTGSSSFPILYIYCVSTSSSP
jgi:hypothetical protein